MHSTPSTVKTRTVKWDLATKLHYITPTCTSIHTWLQIQWSRALLHDELPIKLACTKSIEKKHHMLTSCTSHHMHGAVQRAAWSIFPAGGLQVRLHGWHQSVISEIRLMQSLEFMITLDVWVRTDMNAGNHSNQPPAYSTHKMKNQPPERPRASRWGRSSELP